MTLARGLWFLALAAACAPAGPPASPEPQPPAGAPSPASPPDACLVAGAPGHEPDTVDLVLDPPPRRELPPRTGSDWLEWGHSYDTLFRLDCDGVLRPALATAWQRTADGRAWVVTLGDSTADVMAAWTPLPARLVRAGVESIQREGEHELRFTLSQPNDSLPAVLSEPVLGLRQRTVDPGHVALPVVRIHPPPGDLRDAVDVGTDIVVTADPGTLDYARRQPELAVVPLPWSEVYSLLSAQPFAAAADLRFREALVRDVVRADARPADSAPPTAGCSSLAQPAGATDSRLAYIAGDPTAASLAARLVALGAAGPHGTAVPLERTELEQKIARGELGSAIVSAPASPNGGCPAAGYAVTPLVETRGHLVARRDGPAIRRDAFGVLRLDRRVRAR